MKTYEIRVVQQRSGGEIYASSHTSDHAAIRRAIALAKPGQAIEVWCGARCVYVGIPAKLMPSEARPAGIARSVGALSELLFEPAIPYSVNNKMDT
jgi:hypothetical protein